MVDRTVSSDLQPVGGIGLALAAVSLGPLRLGVCACCLIWAGGLAAAQVPVTATHEATSLAERRSFTPEDFARFAPRTALDMVEEIPGFTIRQGGSARGLGQADVNVLINGQRVSSKSNGPVDALSRIPASDVLKLDILDGASLDIGGLAGQVLNVITQTTGGVSGRYRYSPEYRTGSGGSEFRWGDGEVSLAGGRQSDEWTLSIGNTQRRLLNYGPEQVFDGSGALIDLRDEIRAEDSDQPSLAGSYARTGLDGNVFNLTAELNGFIFSSHERSDQTGIDQPDRVRTLRSTEDEYNYEWAVDYAFDLARGRFKWIGYHRFEDSPTVASARTVFANGDPDQGSVFTRQADEAESILRTEYVVDAFGGDWQAALEGARNYLDIEAELEERDPSGQLQPVELPGANARVDEDRVEATLTYGRSLSRAVRLQSSIGAEYSAIEQSGEFGLTRDFVRPKGFVTLDWEVNPDLDLSFRLERVVGQLNFFDFIASADVNQDQDNVSNVNLVPPQSWLFEIEANRNLGRYGSVTVSGFAEDITDIVDQIPIEGGGQAPGNIDQASRWGLSGDLTLFSEPFGWEGARLNVSGAYVDSSVEDPLLGTTRRISNQDYINFNARLRQDFIGTDWAAGLNLDYDENTPSVRLDQESFFRTSFAFASAFVEHKNVWGLTVRATVGNLMDRRNQFTRTVFSDRSTNEVAFVEDRVRRFGTIYTLDLEGSF
ncbi:MAG: outer membrane beta-barrel protein [Pseudomonadota bacterium]